MAPGYLEYLKSECSTNDGQIFVAEMNDKIVGFSCVWIEEQGGTTTQKEKIAYFSDLYVKLEFRRLGVGRLLIEARKKHAIDRDIKRAQVYTLAGNAAIQKALKSNGFDPVEIVWETKLQ